MIKLGPMTRVRLTCLGVGFLAFTWGFIDAITPGSLNPENDFKLGVMLLLLAIMFAIILPAYAKKA